MTQEAKAGTAGASGHGGVMTASGSTRRSFDGECFASGGIITGVGQIIRKDGTIIDFNMVSEPLTVSQAKTLNQAED